MTTTDQHSRAPRHTTSVRTRIVATVAVLILSATGVLLALTWLVLDRTIDANVRTLLEERADAIAAAIVKDDGTLRDSTGTLPGDELAWVFDPAGVQLAGPIGSAIDDAATALSTVTRTTVTETEDWLLLAQPLPAAAGVVVVGTSLEPYESTQHAALLAAAIVAALVATTVTALAAWIVTRALKPVASMARSAAAWSEHELGRRFDLGPPHDEITELGAVLDQLLARVARALISEQRLTSELAHELRTPLTVVRAEAELAANEVRTSDPQLERLQRILASTDHMTNVVDSLMSAARGATAAAVRVPVDDLLAAATASPAADASAATLVVEADPTLHIATPLDIAMRALSPLVANAIEHGGPRVTLRAHPRGALIEITVQDDGSGVPDGDRDAIFAPGHRSTSSTGAGLGLPLARRVARASGGDVELAPNTPTTFSLTLPSA